MLKPSKKSKSGTIEQGEILQLDDFAANPEGHIACDIILRGIDDLLYPSSETYRDQVCMPDPCTGAKGCEDRLLRGCFDRKHLNFTESFHACECKKDKLQEEVLTFIESDYFGILMTIIDPRLDAEMIRVKVYDKLTARENEE
jgi:hypothetical protein